METFKRPLRMMCTGKGRQSETLDDSILNMKACKPKTKRQGKLPDTLPDFKHIRYITHGSMSATCPHPCQRYNTYQVKLLTQI